MAGQKSTMQTVNSHIAPTAERISGRGSGVGVSEQSDFVQAMLAQRATEATSSDTQTESAPKTLSFRESLQTLSPDTLVNNAGEQVGLNGLGRSGVIFGHQEKTEQALEKQRETIRQIRTATQSEAAPRATAEPTRSPEETYRVHQAQALQKERAKIKMLMTEAKARPSGAVQTLSLQTEQSQPQQFDLSQIPVFHSVLKALQIAEAAAKNPSLVVKGRNSAKRGGIGLGIEGGRENKIDMVAAMEHKALVEAAHEFNDVTGE